MKEKYLKRLLIAGFILGFGILIYPLVSQIYYDFTIESELDEYRKEIENIDPPELKTEKIQLAEAFNEALEPDLVWEDPYSDERRDEGVKEYAQMLELKEKIGLVNIPKINVSLPIYAGTSEKVLQNAVGHLEGTSLPVGGKNTHSVITAHRGLPNARLFTDLDKLEIDDTFSVETLAGELFYKVDEISVIEPTETDSIRVVDDKDYFTLLTCTPYMINSHRLLVRGYRIPEPKEEEREEQKNMLLHYLKLYWYYLILILATLTFVVIIVRKNRKN